MAEADATVVEQELDKVKKHKMYALSAKHLHQNRLDKLRKWSTFTDCLAFVFPVLYVPVRYLAKGTNEQNLAEHSWEFIGAVLAASAAVKLFYKWSENAVEHSQLRDKNIEAVTQADLILRRGTSQPIEEFDHFYKSMDDLEKEDRESITKLSDKERHLAYREALKDFDPEEAICRYCHASAWRFKKGSCQACGNTPVASSVQA